MTVTILALALTAPLSKDAQRSGGWAEFRGPDGTGHYTGPAVPTKWGTDTNVVWKAEVPGLGWSSPVLAGGKLYLTTAVPKGEDHELRLLCLNAATGKAEWDRLVFTERGKTAPPIHKKNSHASPTPVTDGVNVFVHFGHLGTACYDPSGDRIWATQEYTYTPQHGNGGSPILVGDSLVFSADGTDEQFVVALDAKTGSRKWKKDRNSKAKMTFSFATAQLVEHKGARLLVSPASDFVAAYDPTTGDEVWRVNYPKPGWSVVPRPVYGHGLVFVCTGFVNQHVLAIDPAGKGDITATHVKWMYKKYAPNTPTPLLVGDELYTVSDQGTMACLDAKTGKVHWEERLKAGATSASPVLLNGKIYVTGESGIGLVVQPDNTGLKVLSENDLKEKTFATFVPHAGAIYARTQSKLYKFAEQK
jgi:outer membrane protein assembly factor BamB